MQEEAMPQRLLYTIRHLFTGLMKKNSQYQNLIQVSQIHII